MPERAGDIMQERVWIDGPRRLAGELAYPMGDDPVGAALLVNPHPYMGGSMHNNVIAHLHAALATAGLVTLRFDYSGVGESAGGPIDVAKSMAEFWATNHAPVDALMIEDAACAMKWLRERTRLPLCIVGYSFGCHVATRIVPDDAASLALISPTITHHEFAPGFPRGAPTLVITSDNDFATPITRFDAWLKDVAQSDVQATCCIAGAQHFFLGQEPQVSARVAEFALLSLANQREAAR